MTTTTRSSALWGTTAAAAALLMITMGSRQSFGLFVSPLNSSTGLGLVTISFALAVSQFVWGLAQPIAGAFSDRYGPARVLAVGALLLAAGIALTPFMTTGLGLVFSIGILMAAGSGAGSFSVLIGAASQRVPATARGTVSGVINAGGSFGQFVFAPLTQRLITVMGAHGALWTLAALSLLVLPLARLMRRPAAATPAAAPPGGASAPGAAATPADRGLKRAVLDAVTDRSYLLLCAGFFTCGFHIAFLVTHLPGEVDLCGLPPSVASWSLAIIGLANIVGSLAAGWSINRWRGKSVLFAMYGSRAVLILLYLAAPKTALTFYVFAAGLGLTWLATVPPTAAVVGKLHGVRYLATLFGLTLLAHQVGGFFGAWLGGIAVTTTGNYLWMWYADAALAVLAAVLNLPIRESAIQRGLAAG